MADKKISALTAVTSLSNTDAFPVVQGAQTKKATIADIKTYLPTASSTQTGLLSNTDWSTFNNKQAALTLGNLTESTSSVLTITGATGAIIGSGATIQVKQASGSQAGYLSSTDWTTFNTKQNSLTLTTTGTGAATLVGSTLNIPTGITAALTSLNGQSGSSQTFATATTGTDFTIASVGDVHTFAIPSASASKRGLLTSTDWSTFNSKEPALTKGNLTETTSSVLTITGGTGSVIGSGTTIAVTRSTALADGYLKASDFSTFAAKQDAITLTTSGTSGAASFVGNVLNIPNYSSGVISAITSLNGDTSASQTFATGSSGTDFAISTAGSIHTFNIPNSDGVNVRGLITKADWQNFNTAYTNRITALTTTGTSGSATLSSNTLNIPQYQGALTLTTTGSSGVATLVGNTLNIPQYSGGGITSLNSLTGATQTFATGTSGTDFSISSSGTAHTFNIPTASSSNRGLLSTTDWSTFNGKQSTITLTTTGTSGAATFISNTLNIPQYGGGSSKITSTFTESIPTLGSAIIAEPITCNLDKITATGTLLFDQRLFFIAVYLPAAATITGVKWIQGTQGVYTANNYNGVALYTLSGGTYTRVALSTDDGNIWKATANTMASKAFSSTYSASAGLYFIAMLYCRSAQTTGPTILSTQSSSYTSYTLDFTNSAKVQGLILSQASMPSTFAGSSASNTTPGLYCALY